MHKRNEPLRAMLFSQARTISAYGVAAAQSLSFRYTGAAREHPCSGQTQGAA